MSQVWLLQQVDYEDVQVLGVYTTRLLAEAARGALWAQYQRLSEAQRSVVGPYVLRMTDAVTLEHFQEWHAITEQEVNVVPETYCGQEPATSTGRSA